MAHLRTPPPEPRVSQILPTVKCSSCNQPVAIAELGEHICAPLPPVPPLPSPRPPASPRSAAALLPTRLQSLVSFPRSQPPPHAPPQKATPLSPPRSAPPIPSSPPQRARAPSTASSFSTASSNGRPERVTSPPARPPLSDASQVLFPTRSGPSDPPTPQRRQTPVARSFGAPADASSPLRGTTPRPTTPGNSQGPPGNPPARPRAPSSASTRPSAFAPNSVRQPVQSSPAPFSSQASGFRAPSHVPPITPTRPRAATNVSGHGGEDDNIDVIYSTAPTPQQPLRARAPSNASVRRPSHEQSRPMNTVTSPPPAMPPLRSPPAASKSPPANEPNTASGGSAGMAGVGRRGFAAAARAAMFTVNMNTGPGASHAKPQEAWAHMAPQQGMDGRRANAPKFLDIASAATYASAHTPPLSPGSAASSPSPHTPHSQKSPVSADIHSPASHHSTTPTNAAVAPAIAPSAPSSPGAFAHKERVVPPALEPPKTPLPATPTTPSSIRLPFFEKFKNKLPEIDTGKAETLKRISPPPPPSPTSSDSEYGGLAYADSAAESDEDDVPLAAITKTASPSVSTSTAASFAGAGSPASTGKERSKVRFPSVAASESQYTASNAGSPRVPQRSLSASTGSSSYTARTTAKSTGALDRALDTLFEDPLSPTSTASPGALPKPLLPDGQRDSKPPKLPARSHTSPTLGAGTRAAEKKRARPRACVRCERTIDDGRWIQMDGGSVLCDRCWKNMYLPKCRRCNLTIEKAAVSSSDGQLKGKYHRDCFNCHTCHKPFPDKSFYVFDGKPFCGYHYHEANNSLCAAATCGQPIEGPCAVSHGGQRFHPEHLLCEHARCTERLVEYYEVGGRMLCERHAQPMMDADADEDDAGEDDIASDTLTRAMKRTTRFIDLAAFGGSALR